ncbi:hypothetical protein AAFG13_14755 [Bradyrhizobium sp. B124]|uniref:hypothetical protein n=1 Tax=Bradyrhizobium sp. B124 TaxID=3140245 RepID=UPI003183E64C
MDILRHRHSPFDCVSKHNNLSEARQTVSGTGSLTATRNAAEFICVRFNVLIRRLFEPRIAMRHRMGTSSLAARLTFSARNLLLAFVLMRAAL